MYHSQDSGVILYHIQGPQVLQDQVLLYYCAIHQVLRLRGEDVGSGKRRQRVTDNLRHDNCTNISTNMLCANISTNISTVFLPILQTIFPPMSTDYRQPQAHLVHNCTNISSNICTNISANCCYRHFYQYFHKCQQNSNNVRHSWFSILPIFL